MIRVRTPSRLHFGLISLPTEQPVSGRRNFGGVGLMIDKPGIDLRVERSGKFEATGPLAERALRYARTYCERVGIADAFHVHVESAAPEHMGLGTGTQLGLAVARAIAELTDQPHCIATKLGPLVDRGRRSAIGIHGFDLGGFLVEAGKRNVDSVSPLVVRQPFPADWRVLLLTPREGTGTHGSDELGAFAALKNQSFSERATEAMCRLALLDILPALVEHDLDVFGEALYEYNRRAGELFESVQGGVYANSWIEDTVKRLRAFGLKGVGQSSWGPVVFAMVGAEDATELSKRVSRNVEHETMLVAGACNRGAVLSTEY